MKKEIIYLVAYYSLRPKNRVRTQIKGWMDNVDNIQYDEQVAVTTKLRKPDQDYAKIILDMSNKKVVRNRWNNTNDFDVMFEYFAKGYPKYTYEIMGRLDPEYTTRFMTQIGDSEQSRELINNANAKQEISAEIAASVSQETVVVNTAELSR